MTPFIPTGAEERSMREAMEDLRVRIESHILNQRETACVDVVHALANSPVGLKTMHYGFGGKLDQTSRGSFSEFCIYYDAVDVLRAVLVAAPQGIGIRSTCSSANKVGDSVWEGWRQSVHQYAVKCSSPEGLRLALEYAPDERCLTHAEVLHGTLHANALIRLFSSPNVAGAAECCRVLLDAKAPMAENGPGVGIADGIFFDGGDWGPDRSDFVLNLLPEYIARGLVDLDGPVSGLNGACAHMLSLRAAMEQGTYTGAATCIDLGCNIELAMGATDILDVCRSLALDTEELRHKMVASITSALMRRQLKGSVVVVPLPVEPEIEIEAPRRRRRAL